MSAGGPGKLNLQITRGDGYLHELDFTDGTSPLDLTGRAYLAQIRAKKSSTDADGFAIDTSRAAEGVLLLSLVADQTRALPAVGVWDLQETVGAGDPVTLLAGAVVVTDDVTR